MRIQTRRQLILDLAPISSRRVIDDVPDGLVQALADLLLEALGETATKATSLEEIGDESQDHA